MRIQGFWRILLAALGLVCFGPAVYGQNGPVTLKADHFDVTSFAKSATVTVTGVPGFGDPKTAVSGTNAFFFAFNYSTTVSGVPIAASSNVAVGLQDGPSFTDSKLTGAYIALTPKPVFNWSSAGSLVDSVYLDGTPGAGFNAPCNHSYNSTGPSCTLSQLTATNIGGQNFAVIYVTLYVGQDETVVALYFAFGPAATDKLVTDVVLPVDGAKLEFATADNQSSAGGIGLPPIFADLGYDLETMPQGKVYLALSQNGQPIVFSNIVTVGRGTGVVGYQQDCQYDCPPDAILKTPPVPNISLDSGSPLHLDAYLQAPDSAGGKVLVMTPVATYTITDPTKLTLAIGSAADPVNFATNDGFTAIDPSTLYFLAGQEMSVTEPNLNYLTVSSQDKFTASNLQLSQYTRTSKGTDYSGQYFGFRPDAIAGDKEALWTRQPGGSSVIDSAVAIQFQSRFVNDNGQVILSNVAEVPVEGGEVLFPITPDNGDNSYIRPGDPANQQRGTAPKPAYLTKGQTISFSINLHLHIWRLNSNLYRCAYYYPNNQQRDPNPCTLVPGIQYGDGMLTDSFQLQLPNCNECYGLQIWYSVATSTPDVYSGTPDPQQARVSGGVINYGLQDPPVTVAANTTPTINASGAAMQVQQNTKDRAWADARVAKDSAAILNFLGVSTTARKPSSTGGIHRGDVPAPGTMLSLNAFWTFDTPIPNDGSFQAALQLPYDPSLFPDDPNFDPTQLQVIALDATSGQFTALPSQIDSVGQTVTATIDSLAVAYGIGETVPAARPYESFPAAGADTGLAVVNLGANPANLQLNGFSSAGSPGNVRNSVAPGAQFAGMVSSLFQPSDGGSPVWVQAQADSNSIAGVAIVSDGKNLEALPLQPQGANFLVLPWVAASSSVTSEIHLANATNFPNNASLYLYGPDGALVDSNAVKLAPKGTLQGTLPSIFPQAPATFTGYVLIGSDDPVTAVALQQYVWATSASPAQTVAVAPSGATQLYAPYIGAGVTLTLVNMGTQDAPVTLTAFADSGSPIGNPVQITVRANQQYITSPSGLFYPAFPVGVNGWLRVDAPNNAVVGEIQFGDGVANAYRAGLPLVQNLQTSLVIPLAGPAGVLNTSVAVASPLTASAVQVTAFDSNGNATGASTIALAPNARSSQTLAQWIAAAASYPGGYVRIDATHPVMGYAILDPGNGQDYAAVAGVPLPPGAMPLTVTPPAPSLSVSPTSLSFGNVTIGTSQTLTVTVKNSGSSSFNLTAITSSNPAFSVTGATVPFAVAGRQSQILTVKFAPTASGPQSGALTLATTDAAAPTLTVSLSGAGVAPVPTISLSPATLDFGSVNTGAASAPKTVTVTNSGPSTVTVQLAIAAPFTVSPTAVTISGNGGAASVSVAFAPASAATYNANLNAMLGVQTTVAASIPVTGQGIASTVSLSLSPPSLDFGAVNVGATSTVKNVVVTNAGNVQASIRPAATGPFTVSPATATVAPNGGTATLNVNFLPTAAGPANGTVTVTIGGQSTPAASMTLTGQGQALAAKLALTPTSLDFKSVNVGATSQAQTVTVTNSGNASATVTLAAAAPFGVSPTSVTVAANGGTATANVTFAPTTAGVAGGTLTAASGGQTVGTVSLTGTGAVVQSGGGSGNIVSLKLDFGTYQKSSGAFTNLAAVYDTDNTSKNWMVGVGPQDITKPLLNPNKTINTPPGNFYFYITPGVYASDVRLTIGWADQTTEVAYFQFAGDGYGVIPWPNEGGATNATMAFITQTLPYTCKVAQTAASNSCGTDDILQVAILGKGGSSSSGGSITVTPASLDFKTVNTGATSQAQTVTLTNTTTASATVTLAAGAPFSVTPTSVTVPGNGGVATASVTFAPTAATNSNGALTATVSGQSSPVASVTLTGVGAAASGSTADVTLKVDGGTFNSETGYIGGAATAYFVNRLTPPSYPATLKSVQIYFTKRSDGLSLNTPLTIFATAIPSGSSSFSGATELVPATLTTQDAFSTFTVPALTINSGDFLVGFRVENPPNIYPADLDRSSPSQHRSYTSTDGNTFALLDNIDPSVAGNLAIRAVATVGSGSGSGASACVSAPANLVSWWPGDGNANDLTGGNNGAATGAVAYVSGEVGQAFSFDGSTSYISIGNPANLRLNSAITIAAWIDPKAGPASGSMAAVLTKWAQQFNPVADTDTYGLWLKNNNGALTMFAAIHQSGSSEPAVQGGAIALNTWTHVAMTFDSASGQFVLYVNGQAVASANSPGGILTSSHNVQIGHEDSSQPRPFNGLIDEVQVFSRALTGSEIQAMVNAGTNGECKH